jgi:hypothetical protein
LPLPVACAKACGWQRFRNRGQTLSLICGKEDVMGSHLPYPNRVAAGQALASRLTTIGDEVRTLLETRAPQELHSR